MNGNAAYINSSLSETQITKALEYAAQGVYKIIYVAPERLETREFRQFAENVDISMVTVDEAHCIYSDSNGGGKDGYRVQHLFGLAIVGTSGIKMIHKNVNRNKNRLTISKYHAILTEVFTKDI